MRYQASSSIYQMSLRVDHYTTASKITSMPPGTVFEGDEIWVATETTGTMKSGDRWLHVLLSGGEAVDCWVAIAHMGLVYCDVFIDDGVVPPVDPNPDSVLRVIKSVITYETIDHRIVTVETFPIE